MEQKQEEKANYIIQSYLLKLNADKSYRIVLRKDIPKQQNDWDCGVFMLMFVKFTVLEKNFNFETSHMKFFREVIRKEIQNQQIELDTVNIEEETLSISTSCSSESSIELVEGNDRNNMETGRTTFEQKPPMFENECGTICWLNSMVQLLLLTINVEDTNSFLRSTFEKFNNMSKLQSTQILRNYLSEYMPELESGQQDAFDFFVGLNSAPQTDKESILNPLSIFTKNVLTCIANPIHSSSSYQPDPEFYVNINIPKDNEPIHDVIEREFQEGTVISDWRCSLCSSQGGLKKKMIQEGLMPRFILVKLRRTERDINGRT